MPTHHTDLIIEYLSQARLNWDEPPNRVVFLGKTGRNWLYRLDVAGLPAYILKLYRSGTWHRSEREALALSKLRELGFKCAPQLFHYAPGSPFFDGRSVLIYSYIPGTPLTSADLREQGRLEQVASLLNQLHRYTATSEVSRLGHPRNAETYWNEIDNTIKNLGKEVENISSPLAVTGKIGRGNPGQGSLGQETAIPTENPYQSTLQELSELARRHLSNHPLLWNSPAPNLTHGDLRLNNFILQPDGSLHLVDWEHFGAGDAAIDLAWFLFLNRANLDHDQKADLVELWQTSSPDPNLRERLLQFYPLIEFRYLLNIVQAMTRWRKNPSSYSIFSSANLAARDDWLWGALFQLKDDFSNFTYEQGRHLLEQTLPPLPQVSDQPTGQTPSVLLQNRATKYNPSRKSLRLTFLSGPYDGFSRLLPVPNGYTSQSLIIGRQEESDIALTYDTELSRRHARLIIEADGNEAKGWLEDLDSRNGTFLDEKRLGPGHWFLQPGQIFRIGRAWLRLDNSEALPDEVPIFLTEHANAALLNSLDPVTQEILRLGAEDARKFNVPWLGVEHLFIGLTRQKGEITSHLLNFLKLDPSQIRAKLRQMAGGRMPGDLPEGTLPLTPRLQLILNYAVRLEAIASETNGRKSLFPIRNKFRSDKHRHLLIALLEDKSSLPARLLVAEGYELEALLKFVQSS